jgi:hypothetical protein
MISRCYSDARLRTRPQYENCIVSEEWKVCSTFSKWMQAQEWQGMHLDKDMIGDGSIYSAQTCVFVPPEINAFTCERDACRGKYMVGVCCIGGKFVASIRIRGQQKRLGRFKSEIDAFHCWLNKKIEIANELACDQKNERVALALRAYADKLERRRLIPEVAFARTNATLGLLEGVRCK